ncbi:MAG TPA: hypothetical protein PLV92_14830, partial [Pirellulaceae bacterium]|nr:hypothetical protein [Pirellulaceae bacterium]
MKRTSQSLLRWLVHTLPGKVTTAICAAASVAAVWQITTPNASIDPKNGRPNAAVAVAREYATGDDAERADSGLDGDELDAASSERVTTPRWQTIA